MIVKMLVRTAAFAVMAGIAWHTPVAQSVAGTVGSITGSSTNGPDIVSWASTTATDLLGGLTGKQSATPFTPVGRCNLTLVADTSGAPRGTYSDLKAAAATLSEITGMQIRVERGTVADTETYAAANDYKRIPVSFASDADLLEANSGQHAYAVTAMDRVGGIRVPQQVRFNDQFFSTLQDGQGANSRYVVILHELGHVAGLDHNDDASSLMAASPTDSGVTDQDKQDLRNATQACR